jgi:hypothetical protein
MTMNLVIGVVFSVFLPGCWTAQSVEQLYTICKIKVLRSSLKQMAKLVRIGFNLVFWQRSDWDTQIKTQSWVNYSSVSLEWEGLNDWFDKSLVTLLSVINFIVPQE